jgi:nucleoside-diphosphate-sugar epimerase
VSLAVVTGAGGFLGSHLVARLRRDGERVRALMAPGERAPERWRAGDAERVEADMRDAAAIEHALAGATTVYHCAAIVGDWAPWPLIDAVTIGGTRNTLVAAARNDARVVLASSIVVYGERLRHEVCHEAVPHGQPQGNYGRSKQAQERIVAELERSVALKCAIIRPANVYGPGSQPWVIQAAQALRKGPTLIGGGDFAAGLVHVDNVVDIFVRAGRSANAIGRVYNAADDTNATWRQYFGDLARISGAPRPTPVARPVARILSHVMESAWRALGIRTRPQLTREAFNLTGFPVRIPYDKARLELGYQPIVDYATGLRQLGDWWRRREAGNA